ncbi:MAG: hypothetical protein SCH98_06115 [Deferrisomatales bacterium]|nr:hypothetical protein [Deferrisomatales bacterium]
MGAQRDDAPYDVGVIHGRFQVLHRDHLRYLLAGRALCRQLVVGVTNPDPTRSRDRGADPHRTAPQANPLTYYERQLMVRAALEAAGVPTAAFAVVPLPIDVPELYRYYVPLDAVFFLTIYDAWGRQKRSLFQGLGLRTHVLWEVSPEQKGLSASQVRERMIRGEPWEPLVPPPVADLMKEWDIPGRLRGLRGVR